MEIEYRVAKWVVFNLYKAGLLSQEEMEACVNELKETLNPPTKCIEVDVP